MKITGNISFGTAAAICGLLASTVLVLIAPADGAAAPGRVEGQVYSQFDRRESDDRLGPERGKRQKDWYGEAYERYEESPYGYYDEDTFYNDFDLHYWERDEEERDEHWYERRFHEYDENGLRSTW